MKRKISGIVLLLLSLPLIKALLSFPIGVYAVVTSLAADKNVNTGYMLGRLSVDFVCFVLVITFIYYGFAKLLTPGRE